MKFGIYLYLPAKTFYMYVRGQSWVTWSVGYTLDMILIL